MNGDQVINDMDLLADELGEIVKTSLGSRFNKHRGPDIDWVLAVTTALGRLLGDIRDTTRDRAYFTTSTFDNLLNYMVRGDSKDVDASDGFWSQPDQIAHAPDFAVNASVKPKVDEEPVGISVEEIERMHADLIDQAGCIMRDDFQLGQRVLVINRSAYDSPLGTPGVICHSRCSDGYYAVLLDVGGIFHCKCSELKLVPEK